MRILLALLIVWSMPSWSQLPPNAVKYAPMLQDVIESQWPEQSDSISIWAAQIHVESCITATHSRCWSPTAELKTSHEYGFGIGQITRTSKFNKFEELKSTYKELSNWKWESRFDIHRQLLAMVLMNRTNWIRVSKFTPSDTENQTAFTLVTYNSGYPIIDRKLCQSIKGCDPHKWYGNIELHSMKSKTKLKEYGNRSFFEISREYPRKVMYLQRPLYRQFDRGVRQ